MKKESTLFFIALLCCTALNAQTNRANTKKSIPYKANYQRMAAGGDHTLEIRDGTLWAWGDNFSGQLGDGTTVFATNLCVPNNMAFDSMGNLLVANHGFAGPGWTIFIYRYKT